MEHAIGERDAILQELWGRWSKHVHGSVVVCILVVVDVDLYAGQWGDESRPTLDIWCSFIL